RLAVHDPMDARADQIADIARQWRRLGRQGAEDEIAEGVDAQLLEAVLFEVEARWHAALTGNAAAEGHTVEIAFEIIAPGMIDAGQILGMPAPLETDEIAAMGAAVDHRVDLAVLPAGDDDRRLAEKGRQVIAGLRQLPGECEILPGRPEKDPAEFGTIDLGIGEHPIGDAGIAFGRPFVRAFWLHGGE